MHSVLCVVSQWFRKHILALHLSFSLFFIFSYDCITSNIICDVISVYLPWIVEMFH